MTEMMIYMFVKFRRCDDCDVGCTRNNWQTRGQNQDAKHRLPGQLARYMW